jgi:hypothetical protein
VTSINKYDCGGGEMFCAAFSAIKGINRSVISFDFSGEDPDIVIELARWFYSGFIFIKVNNKPNLLQISRIWILADQLVIPSYKTLL